MGKQTIARRCLGVNNRVSPDRLKQYSYRDETYELASGVNIFIDDNDTPTRRCGQLPVQTGEFHSLFRDTGECLVVKEYTNEAALYLVNTDLSLTGVRSGMTKEARMSYAQVGTKIYYMNGNEQGYVENGISKLWPEIVRITGDGYTFQRPVNERNDIEYTGPPLGSKLAFFQNRIWIVEKNVMWPSQPDLFGTFDREEYLIMPTDILMVRPVAGGMWISDSKETGFVPTMQAGEKFENYRYIKKASVPAHEWSACHQLVDLSNTRRKIPGLSALWSSDEGLCIGTADGQLIIETDDKLIYPHGGSGATVASKNNVINIVR